MYVCSQIMCSRSDKLCSRSDELCSRCDELCSRSDELCSRSDELCSRSDELCSRSDELCSRRATSPHFFATSMLMIATSSLMIAISVYKSSSFVHCCYSLVLLSDFMPFVLCSCMQKSNPFVHRGQTIIVRTGWKGLLDEQDTFLSTFSERVVV